VKNFWLLSLSNVVAQVAKYDGEQSVCRPIDSSDDRLRLSWVQGSYADYIGLRRHVTADHSLVNDNVIS